MRRHGRVGTPSGLGPGDHLCWAYEGVEDLAAASRAWLTEGRSLGQRLLYVGPASAAELFDDADALIDRGALEVMTLDAAFPDGTFVEPQRAVAAYQRRVDRAIADGYSGVRVLGEVTPLVRDAARLDARLRWEQHVDDLITRAPISAMCAYALEVGDDAISTVGAVHPLVHDPHEVVAFHVHSDDGGVRVVGTLEGFARPLLDRVLRTVPLPDGDVVVDLGALEYASAACTASLHRFTQRHAGSRRIVLHGAPSSFRRVWDALGLDGVAFT